MTAVSPYRHWHFFDAYPPGFLRAVYRGNGIPLPWGNMSLVSDPCPRWAVFRLLRQAPPARHGGAAADVADLGDAGWQARAPVLLPFAGDARCGARRARAVGGRRPGAGARGAGLRRRWPGDCGLRGLPARRWRCADAAAARAALQSVSQVLNIDWIDDALAAPASVICPRSGACPRSPRRCGAGRSA